jgi:(S)-citramalyl-CoA lyase
MTIPNRRRSWLFTPATKPDRFDRAASTGADVLIIDLEDAVALADKVTARQTAIDYLARPSDGTITRALRINPPGTSHGLEDLLSLLNCPNLPDYVLIPKVESSAIVRLVDGLFTDAGRPTQIVALIETAQGMAAVEEIACATPQLRALFFGAADHAAALGAEVAWEPMLYARSRLLNAAALSGIETIDSPYFDLANDEGLHAETQAAVRLGFTAKAAIHPKQIGVINDALTPSAEAVAEAQRILEENAKGVGVVGGRMVDEAVARKARRVLAAACTPVPV